MRASVVALLPIWIMIAVAAHQRWRVHAYHQNPWKGGGFGMFSDLHTSWVAVRIFAVDADGKEVELHVDRREAFTKFNMVPTLANLRLWALQIMQSRWRRSGTLAVHFAPGVADSPLRLTRVRMHHRLLDFDGRTGTYRSRIHQHIDIERERAIA